MHEGVGRLKTPPFSPGTAARQRAQQRELARCQCVIARGCDAVAGVAGHCASGVAAEGRQLLECRVGVGSDATGRTGPCQCSGRPLRTAQALRTASWRDTLTGRSMLTVFTTAGGRSALAARQSGLDGSRVRSRVGRWQRASSDAARPSQTYEAIYVGSAPLAPHPSPTPHAPNRRHVAARRRPRARQTE